MDWVIDDFKGPHRWLSNFEIADIGYEGLLYPSTEHAYQAAKCVELRHREDFAIKLNALGERLKPITCYAAKHLGRLVKMRPDWEEVKDQVMLDVVRIKFNFHKKLGAKLLATGHDHLLEGNDWHDNYWGDCWCARPSCRNEPGKNKLGEILMKVRAELKEKST